MVYINENWSLYGPKVLGKLKLKFWRPLWKYFVRKNQSTQNFKESKFILLSIIFI